MLFAAIMLSFVIEILSVVCNIVYLILLTRKDKRCWPFGIVGSALGVLLMVHTSLYGQALIYTYYVLMGFYGWYHWHVTENEHITINEWKITTHVGVLLAGALASLSSYYLLTRFTQTQHAEVDAFVTVFAFIATYMQAKKIRSSWIYFFIINLVSAGLYAVTNLPLYAVLMLVYTAMCVSGYINWRKLSR